MRSRNTPIIQYPRRRLSSLLYHDSFFDAISGADIPRRVLIVERTQAGMKEARRRGVKFGGRRS